MKRRRSISRGSQRRRRPGGEPAHDEHSDPPATSASPRYPQRERKPPGEWWKAPAERGRPDVEEDVSGSEEEVVDVRPASAAAGARRFPQRNRRPVQPFWLNPSSSGRSERLAAEDEPSEVSSQQD